MDPLRGRFELDELLTRLGVAPQLDRPLHEAPLPRRAVFLDQLLDAGTPFRRFDSIDRHPTVRVPQNRAAHCPRLHSRGRSMPGIVTRCRRQRPRRGIDMDVRDPDSRRVGPRGQRATALSGT